GLRPAGDRRRPCPRLRVSPPRRLHLGGRNPPLRSERRRPLLPLQDRAVPPPPPDRERGGLRLGGLRGDRGRPVRLPARPPGGRRGGRPLPARGSRPDEGRRARAVPPDGAPDVGPSRLARPVVP